MIAPILFVYCICKVFDCVHCFFLFFFLFSCFLKKKYMKMRGMYSMALINVNLKREKTGPGAFSSDRLCNWYPTEVCGARQQCTTGHQTSREDQEGVQ